MGLDGVCGLLADGYHIHKTFGGKLKPVAASGVTGRKYPPPERHMSYSVNVHCAAAVVWRTVF